jgi:cytochrome c-type biogenesis protein CcmH
VRRAAALLLALAAIAAPATAAPRASFNSVESQLMCDTCNVPLNIADSPRADQERREVRRLIGQGLTEGQILDRFRAEYGPNVLAKPEGGGGAITVWAVPAAVVAAAIAGVALLLPRWRRRRGEGGAALDAAPELAPADARRLEQDLARYDL